MELLGDVNLQRILIFKDVDLTEVLVNLLKPTGYVMHQQFNLLKPTGYVMHQQFNIQTL